MQIYQVNNSGWKYCNYKKLILKSENLNKRRNRIDQMFISIFNISCKKHSACKRHITKENIPFLTSVCLIYSKFVPYLQFLQKGKLNLKARSIE